MNSSTRKLSIIDRLALFLAEGAGLGRLPKAPGTFGSLWGLVIGAAFHVWHLSMHERAYIWLVLFVIGIPICQRAATIRNAKDPGSVVWDEIAAFPLVYLPVETHWLMLIGGFFAFRFFDIWKPWPVKRLERLPGGLGIMADDQAAGVYAAAVLIAIQVVATKL